MENLCECGNELHAKGRCKKCYNKLYREENAEKLKQRQKQYREENAEKLKQRQKQYCQKNPEKIKQIQKRYYQKNAEKLKQRDKRYREELHDNYVINKLKKNTTLTAKDIRQYPELIELKRAELQVKRQLIK